MKRSILEIKNSKFSEKIKNWKYKFYDQNIAKSEVSQHSLGKKCRKLKMNEEIN